VRKSARSRREEIAANSRVVSAWVRKEIEVFMEDIYITDDELAGGK
jgi:hypothetical protein